MTLIVEITDEISYINESKMNILGTIVYDEEIRKAFGQHMSETKSPYKGKARKQLRAMYNALIEQI